MGIMIIAEAGVNHNGDLGLAKKLIDAAAAAGADVVKFQLFNPSLLVSKNAAKAEYQEKTTDAGESQLDMLKRIAFSIDDHREAAAYCAKKGIVFNSAPFDLESIAALEAMKVPFWKIPSGEITNYPYLLRIAATGKPVVLSSGMSGLEDLRAAVALLWENGAGKITVLHCNTEYPTPYGDVNLNAMLTIKRELGVSVGYSDHTQGIAVPAAAAALGAEIIEKHFTLDRNMEGPDHRASLEPYELAEMVRGIRQVEAAMGNGLKVPSPSERKNTAIARKSIVAARDIKKGEALTEENITAKRPGTGVSPMRWRDAVGSRAIREFAEDELIEL